MAGGWSRDGAVQDQIDDSIKDELARIQAMRTRGQSLSHCVECGEAIPEQRRKLVAGVRYCVSCQQEHDEDERQRGGINRRGSKDSQLK